MRRRVAVNSSMGSLRNLCLAATCGAVALTGCGSSANPQIVGGPVPAPGIVGTVKIAPALNSLTTSQALAVAVNVSGPSGDATPTGTVVVTSGGFSSAPVTLVNGAGTVNVKAGLLPVGSDTLTAFYTPASGSPYSASTPTASTSVNVMAGTVSPSSVTAVSATYPTAGAPFQAITATNGTVYVGVSGAQNGVEVFTPGSGGLTAACVNPLSAALVNEGAAVSNLSFLPNGVDLALGAGVAGADFLNIAATTTCTAAGTVISQGSVASDQGTQEVAVTPDGKYAFVSNEYGVAAGATTEGNIGVVQLAYDGNGNVTSGSTLLGQISAGGTAIAGMLLSPDGTRLYVTSEIAGSNLGVGNSNAVLGRTGCVQQAGGASNVNGTLTVINVAAAEASAGQSAILVTEAAGCSPVRMAETADGSTLWVAVRGDNRVLAFSTGALEFYPANALLGYASTGGTAPVGIRLFHNQQLLAVANSNRFNTGTANATILNVTVPSNATVLDTIATGLFPREVTVGADDNTLYLTNYSSNTLQIITPTVH